MIESCFGNHLNVQHATDYMGTYLMYLWAINVIVIIDFKTENPSVGSKSDSVLTALGKMRQRHSFDHPFPAVSSDQANDLESPGFVGFLDFSGRHSASGVAWSVAVNALQVKDALVSIGVLLVGNRWISLVDD